MNPNTEIASDKNAVCVECGNFGAIEFAGQFLCADCVTIAGSGCAGSACGDAG